MISIELEEKEADIFIEFCKLRQQRFTGSITFHFQEGEPQTRELRSIKKL